MRRAALLTLALSVLLRMFCAQACLQMKDLRPKKFNEMRALLPLSEEVKDIEEKFSLAPYLAFPEERKKFGQEEINTLSFPGLDANPVETVQQLPFALRAIFRF